MPRPPAAYRAVLAEAARFEPRLNRAFRRAALRLRELVSINALAMALAAKDARRALALLPALKVKDALLPAGTIARDAVLRGGRVGAEQVSKAMEAA